MPVTYKLISTVTISSATAAELDFQNIPGTYDDLCLVASLRCNNATTLTDSFIRFNAITTNYSRRVLFGNGSTAGSASSNNAPTWILNANSSTASTFSSCQAYIPNYAGSTNKSVSMESVSEGNATAYEMYVTAGLWSNTAAITRIQILSAAGDFVQHSSAYLYGIKKN